MDTRIFSFDRRDFEDMTFNVYDLPKASDPLEVWPLFKRFSEFRRLIDPLNRTLVFRYIAFMYDPGSPIGQKIHDIPSRKYNCLYYAGIFPDPISNRHTESVIAMSQGLNVDVNSMIFRFASVVRNSDYQFFIGLQEGYEKIIAEGLDDPKRMDSAEKMKAKIDLYREKILNYDRSAVVQEDFFDYVIEEKLNLRPEDIAEATANKQDPIPDYVNPYKLSKRKLQWTVRA